jgi:hypothetical protein
MDALRQRWRMTFGAILPKGLTKDILGRMIAYRIQEKAFGGLNKKTIKVLDRLAKGQKPTELNRRLKPGTVLIREYEETRHTVTVVADGFLWQDKTYPSLSTIALQITGTKWNGPRFFGLRVPGGQQAERALADPVPANLKPRRRGRSSVRASQRGGSP